MLRNRFWNGLKSKRLKNATCIDYNSNIDFDELLSRVREEENELNLYQGIQYQPIPASLRDKYSKATEESSKLELLFETPNELKVEMSELNKKNWWPIRPGNHDRNITEEQAKGKTLKKDFYKGSPSRGRPGTNANTAPRNVIS